MSFKTGVFEHLWITELNMGKDDVSYPSLFYYNGNLFVSAASNLSCIDAEKGSIVWTTTLTYPFDEPQQSYSLAMLTEPDILVLGGMG